MAGDKQAPLDPALVCRSSDPLALRALLTRIGDKWTIFLVLTLDLIGGPARFSELERAVPGISQRMLAMTLKHLERDGFVRRELFDETPPRVTYELTALGKTLLAPLQGLVDWTKANFPDVRVAQGEYDARKARRGGVTRLPAPR